MLQLHCCTCAHVLQPPAKEYVIVNFYHLVDIERPYEASKAAAAPLS